MLIVSNKLHFIMSSPFQWKKELKVDLNVCDAGRYNFLRFWSWDNKLIAAKFHARAHQTYYQSQHKQTHTQVKSHFHGHDQPWVGNMIYLMFEPDRNQYRKALHVFFIYKASISRVNQQCKIKKLNSKIMKHGGKNSMTRISSYKMSLGRTNFWLKKLRK